MSPREKEALKKRFEKEHELKLRKKHKETAKKEFKKYYGENKGKKRNARGALKQLLPRPVGVYQFQQPRKRTAQRSVRKARRKVKRRRVRVKKQKPFNISGIKFGR